MKLLICLYTPVGACPMAPKWASPRHLASKNKMDIVSIDAVSKQQVLNIDNLAPATSGESRARHFPSSQWLRHGSETCVRCHFAKTGPNSQYLVQNAKNVNKYIF